MADPTRTRTITWDDPALSKRDAAAVGGLEYLHAIRDGKIQEPPAARLLGYRLVEAEPGRTAFTLEPAEFLFNPFATVHGGLLVTLMDSAMTSAAMTRLPAGQACATLEVKANFVRPVSAKVGTLRCEATLLHLGASIATAEAKVLAGGKLFAHGTSTISIFAA